MAAMTTPMNAAPIVEFIFAVSILERDRKRKREENDQTKKKYELYDKLTSDARIVLLEHPS